ncbi:MAG: hypothetical protein ABSD10_03730 [Candidatus Saccharimonadales bacterium]|jgi:hypothetical protein
MKRDDIIKIALVAGFSAIISFVIAGAIFNSPAKHDQKVPVVQSINSSFPDVANDPSYNVIFNSNALDPTQTVQIGNSQNTAPFTGSR